MKTAAELIGNRETPLAFLLKCMRNTKLATELRINAAKAAAPYVHRRQPQDVIVQPEVAIEGVEFRVVGG